MTAEEKMKYLPKINVSMTGRFSHKEKDLKIAVRNS
jgi:hypothetical protein